MLRFCSIRCPSMSTAYSKLVKTRIDSCLGQYEHFCIVTKDPTGFPSHVVILELLYVHKGEGSVLISILLSVNKSYPWVCLLL